jgi:hypothetical protein
MFSGVVNGIPTSPAPADLRKVMLKLRWIGLEEEAETLFRRLRVVAPGQCVAMEPPDTD